MPEEKKLIFHFLKRFFFRRASLTDNGVCNAWSTFVALASRQRSFERAEQSRTVAATCYAAFTASTYGFRARYRQRNGVHSRKKGELESCRKFERHFF